MTSKPADDTEMSMDEILASIRRYVADDTPEANLSNDAFTSAKTADVIRLTESLDQSQPQVGPKRHEAEFEPFKQDSVYNMPASPASTVSSNPQPEIPSTEAQNYTQRPPAPKMYQAHPQQNYTPPPKATQPPKPEFTPQGLYSSDAQGYSKAAQSYAYEAPEHPAHPHHPANVVADITERATKSAFSRLADAVKTSGESSEKTNPSVGSTSTSQGSALEGAILEMVQPMIRQWIDQNMEKLVEDLVSQEIEKLKSDLLRR